jgi:DNA-binding transcriptional MerR regulator
VYEYTLAELAETSGLPERTLRLYRTKGLLDPPQLRGRVGYYTIDHLTQLRLVKALTDRRFPLAVIAEMQASRVPRGELLRLLSTSTEQEDYLERDPTYLDREAIEEVKRLAPEVHEELERIGIINVDETGRTHADALSLSLIGELISEGLTGTQIATFAVYVARAADEAGQAISKHLHSEALDGTLHPALIDAATAVFRETLNRRRPR